LLEIIGVGYGRTGTHSLKRALEHLGYGKCYHFRELILRSHAKLWLELSTCDPDHWKKLFNGYRSTTDWPAAAYYDELSNTYPDAKFILTHRNADDWYNSVDSTIFKLRNAMPDWLPGFRNIAKLTDQIIWQGTFNGRFTEKEFAINRYQQHIEDVRRAIRAEQLLIFDVRDGWAPLCAFLGQPVPRGLAFPKSNDRLQMRRYIKILQVMKFIITSILLALLVAFFFTITIQ